MNDFLRRIKILSAEVKAATGAKGIPTFEQFRNQWEKMDLLSQNLYIMQAECPGLMGEPDEYTVAISGYLEKMGLVKERYSLADIVKELEEQ